MCWSQVHGMPPTGGHVTTPTQDLGPAWMALKLYSSQSQYAQWPDLVLPWAGLKTMGCLPPCIGPHHRSHHHPYPSSGPGQRRVRRLVASMSDCWQLRVTWTLAAVSHAGCRPSQVTAGAPGSGECVSDYSLFSGPESVIFTVKKQQGSLERAQQLGTKCNLTGDWFGGFPTVAFEPNMKIESLLCILSCCLSTYPNPSTGWRTVQKIDFTVFWFWVCGLVEVHLAKFKGVAAIWPLNPTAMLLSQFFIQNQNMQNKQESSSSHNVETGQFWLEKVLFSSQ